MNVNHDENIQLVTPTFGYARRVGKKNDDHMYFMPEGYKLPMVFICCITIFQLLLIVPVRMKIYDMDVEEEEKQEEDNNNRQ